MHRTTSHSTRFIRADELTVGTCLAWGTVARVTVDAFNTVTVTADNGTVSQYYPFQALMLAR